MSERDLNMLTIVETSSARVLQEGEQKIAGWTLLSPEDRNIKISPKLEEKVLLLVCVDAMVRSRALTESD